MSEMRNALLIVALVVAATCSTSALEVTNATHGAALSGTTATISGGFSFTGTESFTIVYSLPEGWAYAHNGVASSGSPVFAFNDGGDELSCFFFGTPMSPFTFSFGVTLPAADSAGTISGKVQYTDAQGHPQPDVPIGTALSFPADTHTVTFELGAHGTHNGGGALTQVVAHGTGAVAPAVDAADGWDHTGWDTDFASVTSPLAVTALYAAWPTVATPVFDPLSGAAIPDGGLDVTITCATDGAVIWYTTDGSVPEMNGSTSTQYTATFHIDDTATLKAGAFKTGMTPSAVATAVYTGDGLVLTVENTAGLAGEEVILPITVQEFADVSTFQFSVHWPVSVGTYVGVEAFGVPGLLAGNFGTDEAGTGTLSVSWDDPEGNTETLPDDSVLFGIRVRLAGEPGTSGNAWLDGSPTAVEVTDADVLPLPVSLAPGTLSVRDVVAIGGTCTYYGDDETVADVTVDLAGAESDSLQTGTDGTYHFSNVPVDGDYTVTPTKSTDTPLRNGVTTADISLIRRHILAITPLNAPEKLLAADVNRSDAVTTADIALIRRFILAISDTLPGGLWRFVPSDTVYADSRVPWGAPEARSYTGLQADMFDQDFTAIRLGDVNSSWTAPTDGGRGGDTSPAATRDAAVTFAVSDDVANAGEPVTVDVAVSDFVAVTSVQCTVQWDPAVLTYVSTGDYGLAGLAGGNFGTTQSAAGKLTFSWDDPNAVGVTEADDTVVFSVTFNAIGAKGTSSTVALVDDPTVREVTVDFSPVTFTAEDGSVAVDGPLVAADWPADSEGWLEWVEGVPDHGVALTHVNQPGYGGTSGYVVSTLGDLALDPWGMYGPCYVFDATRDVPNTNFESALVSIALNDLSSANLQGGDVHFVIGEFDHPSETGKFFVFNEPFISATSGEWVMSQVQLTANEEDWTAKGTLNRTLAQLLDTPQQWGFTIILPARRGELSGQLGFDALRVVETFPLVANQTPATPAAMDEGDSQQFSVGVSGGTPDYAYAWTLDGTPIDGAALAQYTYAPDFDAVAHPAQSATKTLVCTVTDSASRAAETATWTINVTDVDRTPSEPTVEITPSEATTVDALTVARLVGSVDLDGDAVSYVTVWTLAGVGTQVVSDTLDASSTRKGQTWDVVVAPVTSPYGVPVVGTAAGTDSITIGNAPPVADSIPTVAVLKDIAKDIALSATDADEDDGIDTLTFTIVTQPGHGTLAPATRGTDSYTYTPAADYTGPDSFQFEVDDGTVTTAVETVQIDVLSDLIPITVTGASVGRLEFGVQEGGTPGADWGLDHLMPPPPNDTGEALFLAPEGDADTERLKRDVRASFDGEVWQIRAEADVDAEIGLSWDPTTLPDDHELWVWRLNDRDGTIVPDTAAPMADTTSLTVPNGETRYYVIGALASTDLVFGAGWNFISLPLQPLEPAVEDVFSSTNFTPDSGSRGNIYTDSIWAWNTVDAQYEAATELTPKVAYWVYVDTAGTLRVSGHPVASPAVPLARGWNSVGVIGPTSLAGHAGIFLPGWFWTPEAQVYQGLHAGDVAQPGIGFWIYATGETGLVPEQ